MRWRSFKLPSLCRHWHELWSHPEVLVCSVSVPQEQPLLSLTWVHVVTHAASQHKSCSYGFELSMNSSSVSTCHKCHSVLQNLFYVFLKSENSKNTSWFYELNLTSKICYVNILKMLTPRRVRLKMFNRFSRQCLDCVHTKSNAVKKASGVVWRLYGGGLT